MTTAEGLKKELFQSNHPREKSSMPPFFTIGIDFRSQASLELPIAVHLVSVVQITHIMHVAAVIHSVRRCAWS